MTPFRFALDPLCLTGCAAYAINQWCLKPRLTADFLHQHFNDLWLIPCALPMLLWLHRRLGWRGDAPPSLAEVFGHLVVWSMLCEVIGPRVWPGATGDPLDVLCYTFGAAVAWAWWNRSRVVSRASALFA